MDHLIQGPPIGDQETCNSWQFDLCWQRPEARVYVLCSMFAWRAQVEDLHCGTLFEFEASNVVVSSCYYVDKDQTSRLHIKSNVAQGRRV